MTYIEPTDGVVRAALEQRAVQLAGEALGQVLDAAVERGLSRERVAEIARQAIEAGGPDGVPERIAAALNDEEAS